MCARKGGFDLAAAKDRPADRQRSGEGGTARHRRVGDFEGAFAAAPVKLDATYTTPDQSHAMMEPHASIAAWHGDKLTVWTSNQMIAWGGARSRQDARHPQGERSPRSRPIIGGGFGGKLFVRADARAGGARRAGGADGRSRSRSPRPLIDEQHDPSARDDPAHSHRREPDGKITAIAHESWSGDLPGGKPETAVDQTRLLYAGANRMTATRLAVLDLPEGNAMRAPGEAPGMMALEIAMDEMAEKLGLDPVEFRIINDTQVDPEKPERPFSQRNLVECLHSAPSGSAGASAIRSPARSRDGRWLVGMGVAAASATTC